MSSVLHTPSPSVGPHRSSAHWLGERTKDLWFRLGSADPDLQGLRRGALAASSLILALLVMRYLVLDGGQPLSVLLFSGVVAMFSGALVRDSSPKAQAVTNAVLPVVVSATVVLASLLVSRPPFGEVVFIAVIAAAVWVRRFGPRGFALGQAAFISYFFSLFLGVSTAMLPQLLVGAFVGAASAALMRFMVIRDRPGFRMRRLLSAYERRCRRLLGDLGVALGSLENTSEQQRELTLALDDLDDIALRIDEALDDPRMQEQVDDSENVSDVVFAVELAAVELTAALRKQAGQLPSEELASLKSALTSMAGDGNPLRLRNEAKHASAQALDDMAAQLMRLASIGVGNQAVTKGGDEAKNDFDQLVLPEDKESAGGPKLSDATRGSLQASVACSITIIAGQMLSPQRWYWAVIACFLVFSNAPTRAVNVRRAVARVTGTAFGIVIGLLLGEALQGVQAVELILLIVSVFVAFWLFAISYSVTVMFLTIALSLLYSLMGSLNESVLVLRLEETLIGSVIGGVIAVLLAPRRGQTVIDENIQAVLQQCGQLLALLPQLTDKNLTHQSSDVRDAVRKADSAFRDLRLATQPSVTGFVNRRSRERRHEMFLVSGIRHRARMLVALAQQEGGSTELSQADLERTRKNIERAQASLLGKPAVSRVSLRSDDPATQSRAGRLDRIDRSLDALVANR